MNAKGNKTPPRILLVGLIHGLPDADRDNFFTDKHFLDYDIVVVDPEGALRAHMHDYAPNIRDGVLSLEAEPGRTFHLRYRETARKLLNFVDKGGTAIVFMRAMPTLEHRVPGDYQRVLREDLNRYLPWGKDSIQRAHGSNIEFSRQSAIGEFWKATNGLWTYQAVFNEPPKGPMLAHVKGHPDEAVASLIRTEKRGHLIITPILRFPATRGNEQAANLESERFVQSVRSLHEVLRSEDPTPQLPDWASDYNLPGEMELRAEISVANARIEGLKEQVKKHTTRLDDLCLHKRLVAGYDSALENAVDRVLTDLGLNVEPGPKGRVDRTATYGDRKFAVEVQGVKRSAKEDHARALTIWVQDVALQDGKEPKGLLVVNAYRDTPLAERSGSNPWPDEIIKICERQGHCAITGLQLLGLYLDAMADDSKHEQLIERMFDTVGRFEGYEDWEEFLVTSEEKASNTD